MHYPCPGSRSLSRRLLASLPLFATLVGGAVQAQNRNCNVAIAPPCQTTLMFIDGVVARGVLTPGVDGNLYGVMSESTYSSNSSGLFYRLTPNGSNVQTLLEYGRNGIYLGAVPYSGLLRGSDGNFYGTTAHTAINPLLGVRVGTGTIFRMAPDGSNYKKLYEFDPFTVDLTRHPNGYAVNATGYEPHADLIEGIEGTTHYLYGSTIRGGVNGVGVIFKIRLDGEGFQVLHTFAEPTLKTTTNTTTGVTTTDFDVNPEGALKNDDGLNPDRRLILVGNNLFGTTRAGGPNGTGVVFRVDRSQVDTPASGSNPAVPNIQFAAFDASPETIIDEDDVHFGELKLNYYGAYPLGGLTLYTDNMLYGTTSQLGGATNPPATPPTPEYGGNFGFGTIFRIDPNASGVSIAVVRKFTGSKIPADPVPPATAPLLEPRSDGSNASGELIVTYDGLLMGTTALGGIQDPTTTPPKPGFGTLFKFNPAANAADPFDANAYAVQLVFGFLDDGYNYGYSPAGGVIELPDIDGGYAYYGLNSSGSPYGRGTVFKFGKPTGAPQPLGTPLPFENGGGSLDITLLAALLLLSGITFWIYRRARVRSLRE